MTPEGPLVSILSPVWNEERHLPAMLDSLAAQTWPHWELLAVDDGSTDATGALLADRAAADGRIRIVGDGAKLGKVAAFNVAHAASAGSILCHVGGDDLARPDALAHRVAALRAHVDDRAVAFFKINLFTDDPATGTVLPRGRRGSMSGGSITVTRPLADVVFPVPTSLPSEDIWWGQVADALARHRVDSPAVVLDYRAHAGNSNPRAKPFDAMDAAIHARWRAYDLALREPRFTLPPEHAAAFAAQWAGEELRHAGATWRLLALRDLPVIERLAMASMSTPALWRLRRRFATAVSGWRGR